MINCGIHRDIRRVGTYVRVQHTRFRLKLHCCIYLSTVVHTQLHMYTAEPTYKHNPVCMSIFTHMDTNKHLYTRTHIHTSTQKYMNMHDIQIQIREYSLIHKRNEIQSININTPEYYTLTSTQWVTLTRS